MKDSVLFGDFFDTSEHNNDRRVYRPLSNQNKLVSILEEYNMKLNLGEKVSLVRNCLFIANGSVHVCIAEGALKLLKRNLI